VARKLRVASQSCLTILAEDTPRYKLRRGVVSALQPFTSHKRRIPRRDRFLKFRRASILHLRSVIYLQPLSGSKTMRLCMDIPAIQFKTILGHHGYIDASVYRAKIGTSHVPTLVNGMSDTADAQVEEVNAERKQGLVVCDRSMAIPMHCCRSSGNQDFHVQLSTIEGMGAHLIQDCLTRFCIPLRHRLLYVSCSHHHDRKYYIHTVLSDNLISSHS
jgi:hypothetical protein